MKKMAVLSLIVLLIVSVASPALAALVNIDFGITPGRFPSSTFGAASGQVGTWNNITALGTTSGIIDINGNPTSINITVTAGSISGNSPPWPTPSDAINLMEDNFWSGSPNYSWSVSMTNLNDGIYNVYLYEPDNQFVGTGAGNVNGISFTNINGNFGSTTFIQGTNYHLLSGVTITGGTLSATGSASPYCGLAGMQITPVPIPSSIILIGSGLVGLVGFRRKFKK